MAAILSESFLLLRVIINVEISGPITKMVAKATDPVTYFLPIGEKYLPLNPLVGKNLRLEFTGQINCIACKRAIAKTYQDGFCFPCTQKLACCDYCIVKPERCHFHLATCREPEWGKQHCMIPHIVYLANSSGIKIGITRKSQMPTRWLDQGAHAALPLFEVPTRRISGLIEIKIAQWVADKTNWRKMLSAVPEPIDLVQFAKELQVKLAGTFEDIYQQFGRQAIQDLPSQTYQFVYPVLNYPTKITSLSFEKTPIIEGTLWGIKGQYLIFDKGVINMRKYTSYTLIVSS